MYLTPGYCVLFSEKLFDQVKNPENVNPPEKRLFPLICKELNFCEPELSFGLVVTAVYCG
jgi:hypothetical protein